MAFPDIVLRAPPTTFDVVLADPIEIGAGGFVLSGAAVSRQRDAGYIADHLARALRLLPGQYPREE